MKITSLMSTADGDKEFVYASKKKSSIHQGQHFSMVASIVSPFLGNIATNVFRQPLDLIKITLQKDNPTGNESISSTIKEIYSKSGVRGFYRGSMLNFVVGGTVASYRWYIYKDMSRREEDNASQLVKFMRLCKTSILLSCTLALFLTPIEHAKIKVNACFQEKKALPTKHTYTGSVDAVKKIHQNYGVRGLYNGNSLTISRDFLAYLSFLLTYEEITGLLNKTEAFGVMSSSIAGVVSGLLSWLVIYPIDTVKTVIQRDSLDNRKWTVFKYLKYLKEQKKLKTLFNGLPAVLVRSAPGNFIFFTVWEYTFNLIETYEKYIFSNRYKKHDDSL